MFDSFKERFAKLEEDHESIRNAKQHVEKYQVVYATVGGSALTLVAVKLFGRPQVIVKGDSSLPMVINNTVAPVIAPVMNNVQNNTGHLHKIVKRIAPDGTEELFETVNDAARELAPEYGIKAASTLDRISKVANGHLPDYRGDRFIFVGIGTQ
jgi:hypothetical protein